MDEARRVSDLLSDDLIAADQALDVVGGTAGAALGLLALYEAVPDPKVLARAVTCGQHLIETRTATETGHRAWVTEDGLRTTGFSHGTAGIAYALLRLYEHTRDRDCSRRPRRRSRTRTPGIRRTTAPGSTTWNRASRAICRSGAAVRPASVSRDWLV